jgi:hypothetical protein
MTATTRLLAAAAGALAALGCHSLDEGIPDTRCTDLPNRGEVVVDADATPTLVTGTPSAKLRGTALHVLGLTIRRVTVAGLEARSESFNFGAWSLDVPADVIESALPAGALLPATVSLDLAVFDACNGNAPAATGIAKIRVEDP